MTAKTCENCARKTAEYVEHLCAECTPAQSNWIRNPRLWLGILPDEPGYYWYEKDGGETEILEETDILFISDNRLNEWKSNALAKKYAEAFKWQGPLRPEG